MLLDTYFWNYHVSLETGSKHSAFVPYSIILAQWSLVGQGVNLKSPMMPFDHVTADFTIKSSHNRLSSFSFIVWPILLTST